MFDCVRVIECERVDMCACRHENGSCVGVLVCVRARRAVYRQRHQAPAPTRVRVRASVWVCDGVPVHTSSDKQAGGICTMATHGDQDAARGIHVLLCMQVYACVCKCILLYMYICACILILTLWSLRVAIVAGMSPAMRPTFAPELC
jgi:hypothetical protein